MGDRSASRRNYLAATAIAALGMGTPSGSAQDVTLEPVGTLHEFDEADARDPVRARLVSERTGLVAGRVNILGIVYEMDPEWHIYWPGQNDTGLPTTFELSMPEGYELRDAVWPAPHRHESPGDLLDHVYEGTTLIMLPVFVPASANGSGTVTITGESEWLMCREACIPGWTEDLSIVLPVASSTALTERSADAGLFREARLRSPRPIASAHGDITLGVRPTGDPNHPIVRARAEGAAKVAFYPHESSSAISGLHRSGERNGPVMDIEIEKLNDERTLEGVLEVWTPGQTLESRVYRISLPLGETTEPESTEDVPASNAG